MNKTQWKLYNFLKKSAMKDPNHWVTHEEICDALPEEFFLNHRACRKKCCSSIQMNIIKINNSKEIEKIIMYKNQSYKLAINREEAIEFVKTKLLNKGCRILKRYWQLFDKISKDGQGKLLSTRGDVIDEESKARPYVEAFVQEVISKTNSSIDK